MPARALPVQLGWDIEMNVTSKVEVNFAGAAFALLSSAVKAGRSVSISFLRADGPQVLTDVQEVQVFKDGLLVKTEFGEDLLPFTVIGKITVFD